MISEPNYRLVFISYNVKCVSDTQLQSVQTSHTSAMYTSGVMFLFCLVPKELPTGGDLLLAESETTTDVNAALRREGTRVSVLDGGGQPQTRLMEERLKQVVPIPNGNARPKSRFIVNRRLQRIDKVKRNQNNDSLRVSQVYSRNTSPHNQYRPTVVSRQSFMSRGKSSQRGSTQNLTNGSLYSETLPSMRSTSSVRLSVYSLFSRQEVKSAESSGFGSDGGRTLSPDPEINHLDRSKTVSRVSKTTPNRVFPASRGQSKRIEPQVPSLYNFVMAEG